MSVDNVCGQLCECPCGYWGWLSEMSVCVDGQCSSEA